LNRAQKRALIPHNHRIIIAKLAETANGPLKYFQARYFDCPNGPESFIEAARMIIKGIQSGKFEVDWGTFDLVKVAENDKKSTK